MTPTQDVIQRLQHRLRTLFDSYLNDDNAKACIEVARQYGWNELAEEMQSDLIEESK